jgi:hypothetical protein
MVGVVLTAGDAVGDAVVRELVVWRRVVPEDARDVVVVVVEDVCPALHPVLVVDFHFVAVGDEVVGFFAVVGLASVRGLSL